MSGQELEVVEQTGSTIAPLEDPAGFVAGYTRMANELAKVVRQKNLVVKIGQGEHARVEAWTMLGSMLGVFPVTIWTRPVKDAEGVHAGWEARVEAHTRDGGVVGAAEAQCLRGEKQWANRDDYALRSMSQTRATSKALRQPLGFVMVLSGFDATPAEEMPHTPPPERAAAPPPQTAVAPDEEQSQFESPLITKPQQKRLFAIAGELGVKPDVVKELVLSVAGVESSSLVPRSKYDELIAAIENEATPF